jgi:hypothetical protein
MDGMGNENFFDWVLTFDFFFFEGQCLSDRAAQNIVIGQASESELM